MHTPRLRRSQTFVAKRSTYSPDLGEVEQTSRFQALCDLSEVGFTLNILATNMRPLRGRFQNAK